MNTVWQKLLKIIQIMLENREILGWVPAFAGMTWVVGWKKIMLK